jgi:hypothetical protein
MPFVTVQSTSNVPYIKMVRPVKPRPNSMPPTSAPPKRIAFIP